MVTTRKFDLECPYIDPGFAPPILSFVLMQVFLSHCLGWMKPKKWAQNRGSSYFIFLLINTLNYVDLLLEDSPTTESIQDCGQKGNFYFFVQSVALYMW